MKFMTNMMRHKVAILYQALAPPTIGGVRKSPKPGGYSDSGADIGYALKRGGYTVVTPLPEPNANVPLNWVFPDTAEGIESAIYKGADVLWANTVVFRGHPLENIQGNTYIVGQEPSNVQDRDDKYITNQLLRDEGLSVAQSIIVDKPQFEQLTPDTLADHGLSLPLVVKPIRGRGSQGVTLTGTFDELVAAGNELLSNEEFGASLMIEQCLSGDEITITVMPAGSINLSGAKSAKPWALRPVRRTNHENGIAPYNGSVPVVFNSTAVSRDEVTQPAFQHIIESCEKAAEIVNARAPIRIDCRADLSGQYFLFDLNMKPNMTGAGRPGRENQDSLCLIAAKADGWNYLQLLESMLSVAWTPT